MNEKEGLVTKITYYDQLVSNAVKERDLFLKEATKQVVARHELFFDIGDIVTLHDGGVWFKVIDFSLDHEELEVRLMVSLKRVGRVLALYGEEEVIDAKVVNKGSLMRKKEEQG